MMISGNRRIPMVYSTQKSKEQILMKYSPSQSRIVNIRCLDPRLTPFGIVTSLQLSDLTFQGGTITWTYTGDQTSTIFLNIYESTSLPVINPVDISETLISLPVNISENPIATFSGNIIQGTFSFTTNENSYYIVKAYTERSCINTETSLPIYSDELQYIPWTFTARESNRNWQAVASSADGTKLAAVVSNGQIYTSTNSGATWTPRDSNRLWLGVASSADGTKLAAVVNGGQIYTSIDSGVNWVARESNRAWYAITSSADGTKLAAVVFNGQIYTSTDSGVNWVARESNRAWYAITSSADGTKLAAVPFDGTFGESIYLSTDSGVTWTPVLSGIAWRGIASSSDGTRLVAAGGSQGNSGLYTSIDSGATWTFRQPGLFFSGVASSDTGTKIAAVVNGGQIYTGVYV